MKRLFVGNVPYQATEIDLQDWFTQAGVHTETVSLIRDRSSGEPRGFGFVEISSDDDAARAVEACNGKEFQGRTLVVDEARPRPESASRNSGGSWAGSARGTSRGVQRGW